MSTSRCLLQLLLLTCLQNVFSETPVCPQGHTLVNGYCVQQTSSCPVNYVLSNGVCYLASVAPNPPKPVQTPPQVAPCTTPCGTQPQTTACVTLCSTQLQSLTFTNPCSNQLAAWTTPCGNQQQAPPCGSQPQILPGTPPCNNQQQQQQPSFPPCAGPSSPNSSQPYLPPVLPPYNAAPNTPVVPPIVPCVPPPAVVTPIYPETDFSTAPSNTDSPNSTLIPTTTPSPNAPGSIITTTNTTTTTTLSPNALEPIANMTTATTTPSPNGPASNISSTNTTPTPGAPVPIVSSSTTTPNPNAPAPIISSSTTTPSPGAPAPIISSSTTTTPRPGAPAPIISSSTTTPNPNAPAPIISSSTTTPSPGAPIISSSSTIPSTNTPAPAPLISSTTTTTTIFTTPPPPSPESLKRCPPGTMLIHGVCRLIYCGKGIYKDGRCIQTECPPDTTWNGLKCVAPETQNISFTSNNTVVNHINLITEIVRQHKPTVENKVETVPKKCCIVMSPRLCQPGGENQRWKCYSRRYRRCGDICTAPVVHLAPPKPRVTPEYVVMPPELSLSYCRHEQTCPESQDYHDCSGCIIGIAQSCSTYCYNYSCGSRRCQFTDQQHYCSMYPGESGCQEADGCIDDWCSGSDY